MLKALVLSSGGVDSTTCVAIAVGHHGRENVSTVSMYYGQKHDKELRCAEQVARFYGLSHHELNLSGILRHSNSALLKGSSDKIRHESYAQQIAKDGEGMVNTYVPFRNGLMLSAATALAVSIYPNDEIFIYIGAHADDAAGRAYADCSNEFIQAITKAASIGTYEKVKIVAPLVHFNKTQVVSCGLKLGAPYYLTWSCYEGNEVPCRKCGTCIDRETAFTANKVTDPILKRGY